MSDLTDTQVVEERNDVEMMRRPHLWPQYPYLPLTRRGHPDDVGLLIDDMGPLVVCCNLFTADKKSAKRIEYADFEAIVDDGWRVD